VIIVLKSDRHPVKSSLALDINILGSIDHDFCDGVIFQQWLKWTKPQDLSRNLFEQPRSLRPREDNIFLCKDLLEEILNGAADIVGSCDIHGRVQL
jgi:hypothetical protein